MQGWLHGLTACAVVVMMVDGAQAQVKVAAQVQVQAVPLQAPAGFATTVYGNAPNRLASTDAVFVGRVVALEPMDIEAAPAKGQAKVTYRIAVIQVTEAIRGLKKDAKSVRVGFPVSNNGQGGFGNVQIQIQGGIQPLGGRRVAMPTMNLQVGQDGLFFLAKHNTESFFLAPTYQTFVNRQNNQAFDGEVKSAKQICKVIDNPTASLKSQDKDERYTAAAVLVSRYRSSTTGLPMKQVPINAEESKLILKAMAEGDWTAGRYNATVPTPYELFNQLGINANDGYKLVNVRNQQDIMQTMQKWLTDHSDKYQIKKLVSDPNAKAPVQPRNQPGALGGGIRLNRQVQPVPAPAPLPKNDK